MLPDATGIPGATVERLRRRARILDGIRAFFAGRGVLEVETPVLCRAGAVDAHLDPIPVEASATGVGALWLVTSPEHSMKRLLAAGSGPIFQITRAFRAGELGRLHNPEFAILEWYRPGLDHVALMDEVEDLVRTILGGPGVAGRFDRVTYRDAFLSAVGVDPFRASVRDLAALAASRAGSSFPPDLPEASRDDVLNVLLASAVEPTLGLERPAFLLDYPPSQAALARVRPGDPAVAERFELYVRGIELCNGYHELTDASEQERRFVEANAARRALGKGELPMDEAFLAALRAGLPACSGVALGVDRLVMLAAGAERIGDVMAFPADRA